MGKSEIEDCIDDGKSVEEQRQYLKDVISLIEDTNYRFWPNYVSYPARH